MQGIETRKIARYFIFPGIMPRVRALFGSGFGYLAFLIASVYGMVRLLPPQHPYLNPSNIGRFGVRHVIAEASDHLVISKNNIDQIVIFAAIMLAMILLVLQFAFLLYFMFVNMAFAAAPPAAAAFTGSLFNTPNPEDDIALNFLDRIFGVPGVFCNTGGVCTATASENGGIPWPMHTALHNLFEFYSTAMLLVGVLIFLYFVVAVVLETATTGTPFGQRFQNVWVPVRLVLALGLLVPINYGLNSAQYLTFYAAKIGSGMATNGWLRFNEVVTSRMGDHSNPLGEKKENLVGMPKAQSMEGIVQSMSLIHACAYMEWFQATNRRADFPNHPDSYHQTNFDRVKPYFVKNTTGASGAQGHLAVQPGTTVTEALQFFNNGNIVIRFGEQDSNEYRDELGQVGAICGEITIPVQAVENIADADTVGGPAYMLKSYYEMVRDMWFTDMGMKAGAIYFANIENFDQNQSPQFLDEGYNLAQSNSIEGILQCDNDSCPLPTSTWRQDLINKYEEYINTKLTEAWKKYTAYTEDIKMTQEILSLGWGGSGVWYNRVADINGAFLTSTIRVPSINAHPAVMEQVLSVRRQNNANVSGPDRYSPDIAQSQGETNVSDLNINTPAARTLATAYAAWNEDGGNQNNQDNQITQNIFRDAMGFIFGVDGLFDIRGENAHVHPLAQLTMLGKGMVESTIRNLALGFGASTLGAAMSGIPLVGALSSAAGGFFFTTAFFGLTVGVTLYYVLPFMPFLYFFFAVGSWVKSIFEAMVGVPLWALAHLRIDGEGLPGESASQGYFLLFEIMIRPILIVFGLIAAILIFTAQVRILNFIWDLVVVNAAGFNEFSPVTAKAGTPDQGFSIKRDIIDQFFYTIIYTIIVYLLATASFKLIDQIPNNILRWMGASASSFSDQDQNPAEGISQVTSKAGMIQGQQLVRAGQGLAGGLGGGIGNLAGTSQEAQMAAAQKR